MPLNYSKWDALEVSDDSDIEGHPNVDHRSLVNWKRRDIHEKRAVRNHKIASLRAEIATNDVLLPRLQKITAEVSSATDGPSQFSRIVEQLKTNPSPDGPKPEPGYGFDGPGQKTLTYDEMVLSLLLKVYDDAREKGVAKGAENKDKLTEALVSNLNEHLGKLGERQENIKKELVQEEKEKSKKITSEDIHDGWDSQLVSRGDEPKSLYKGKTKTAKVTDVEVLNPKAVESAHVAQLASKAPVPKQEEIDDAEDDDEPSEVPEMTPSLEEFSKLPLKAYSKSFEFIQHHRDVYVPGASDALFVAAFRAERNGDYARAKKCVHQSLLLQYCEKLGKDGVGLFFRRILSGDPRAEQVFVQDFESTYEKLKERTKAMKQEEEEEAKNGGAEQIQLVVEGEGTSISFNIPDGPPPEQITLEGPGTEELDIEEVRKMLQMQWDVYQGFSDELKKALVSQELDQVNKVLGKMSVEEAENVVGLLDTARILNFSEHGVRDATGDGV